MGFKITGCGLICGLGNDPDAVFERMCSGETAFREIYSFDSAPYAQKRAGQIAQDDDEMIADEFPEEDRGLAMLRHAAQTALKGNPAQDSRRALVLATNFGPMETLQWGWRERLDTGEMDEETFAPANGYIARLAETLGCGGPALQISMSCASGAASVASAWDLLASGRADSVLVIAYDSLSEYAWCGLSNLHTVTTDIMRPFDARRSGTIFSEGAAAVLLERGDGPDDALAWVNGVATSNNAFHLTAPRAEAEGSRLVMADAIARAGLSPDAIEHVCAHATSTSANDSTEAAAIRNLFGERINEITVAAHKSQLGHLLGAAGLAEIIVTVMAMRRGIIPPTVNHEQPDPKCMPLDCVPGMARFRRFSTAVTNSAGIGGNNAATVLGATNSSETAVKGMDGKLYVRGIGWVLPDGVGSGPEILKHGEWLSNIAANGNLDKFDANKYLSSVKGYLDPAGACFLAAFRLACGDDEMKFNERRGIASVTHYGSVKSAFAFYAQLVQKGARLASPMVFPHGYANTPGNLAAIEFGCAGPHAVLYGVQDVRESLAFAYARLRDGSADEMFVGAYEAFAPMAFPESLRALNGAMVLRLSATPAEGDVAALDMSRLFLEKSADGVGAVAQLWEAVSAVCD
ncbi:MAG: hypothetical protein IJS15_07825 [Victivallales bacterium]|nr:hypothetical protein [Victivallales bacterium]